MRFALITLTFYLALSGQAANVTPAEWLDAQTKPVFAANHTLPRLSLYGYPVSSNYYVTIARDWGYYLYLGDGSQNSNWSDLSNTNSELWGLMRLSRDNPEAYPAQAYVNQRYYGVGANLLPTNSGWYLTNISGEFIGRYGTNYWTTNGGPGVISPEGDQTYWTNAAEWWVSPIATIASNANLKAVLNAGEYGLFVDTPFYALGQDPRVVAATNQAPWNTMLAGGDFLMFFRYLGYRRSIQYQPTTDRVRAISGVAFYLHYNTDGESFRSLNWYGTNWYAAHPYGFYVRNLSDYPNFESYYNAPGTWKGKFQRPAARDMLTLYLNAVGAFINYGQQTNYSWVSDGWTRSAAFTNDFGSITNYAGLLKSMYMGGMRGAVAGYFANDQNNNSFSSDSPPQWLLQIETLSRVHATFTHLDQFLSSSTLLVGEDSNAWSTDQPSYEFTNTVADVNCRVLARKHNDRNEWLVCAWAADGEDRAVTVTVPTLGAITVTAGATGNLYRAVPGRLSLLDEQGRWGTHIAVTDLRLP